MKLDLSIPAKILIQLGDGEPQVVGTFKLPLRGSVEFDAATGNAMIHCDTGEFEKAAEDLKKTLWGMSCNCSSPWNSITGRTCPVHGYVAPVTITC